MRKKLAFLILILIAVVTAIVILGRKHTVAPGSSTTNQHAASPAGQSPAANFDKSAHSTTNPASIWVIVNKQRAINPTDYAPNDLTAPNVAQRVPGDRSMMLRSPAAKALEQLFAAAKQDGVSLMLASGYRSYNDQVSVYSNYVKTQGQAAADTFSARPGHSEHQTGLAADVEPINRKCEVEKCFGDMVEGKWLAANAYKYGFIIRYPADKTDVTGYDYEPWHIRYIGPELAAEMKSKNITTLEEFFN